MDAWFSLARGWIWYVPDDCTGRCVYTLAPEQHMPSQYFPLVVHATHEAGLKLGGIGAVLDGLLTSPAYNETVARSILVGPINPWNIIEKERLTASGNRTAHHLLIAAGV